MGNDTDSNGSNTPEYSCCTGSLVGRDEETGTVLVVPMYCHRWTCPRCGKRKAAVWRRVAIAGDPERFITLTLREVPAWQAKRAAEKMKRAWAKLVQRIRRKWGECEYLLVFELTKKGTPHIHMLQRGCYIPQAWLSEQWCKLTGSYIVDIRRVRNKADVGNYITKYLGKSVGEVSSALHGLRIVQRSKRWIIDPSALEGDAPARRVSRVVEWTFVFAPPGDVLDILQDDLHCTVLRQDESIIELRPPPDIDDVVVRTVYYARGERAYVWRDATNDTRLAWRGLTHD